MAMVYVGYIATTLPIEEIELYSTALATRAALAARCKGGTIQQGNCLCPRGSNNQGNIYIQIPLCQIHANPDWSGCADTNTANSLNPCTREDMPSDIMMIGEEADRRRRSKWGRARRTHMQKQPATKCSEAGGTVDDNGSIHIKKKKCVFRMIYIIIC